MTEAEIKYYELMKNKDSELLKIINEENIKNSKEFVKNINNYLNENKKIKNFNTSLSNLLDHYYNFIINHPNEWVIVSAINNPTEELSNKLLFELINMFKDTNINFEKKYNKIRIINE